MALGYLPSAIGYLGSRYAGPLCWRRCAIPRHCASPGASELDLVTVLLHTTALRGNSWELNIPKPFLKPGAFHLQQTQTVSTVRLERRLGALTADEMRRAREALAKRLGI
jgi:mRNA interferase MazF